MCDTVRQKLGHTKDPTRTYLLALADTHSLTHSFDQAQRPDPPFKSLLV